MHINRILFAGLAITMGLASQAHAQLAPRLGLIKSVPASAPSTRSEDQMSPIEIKAVVKAKKEVFAKYPESESAASAWVAFGKGTAAATANHLAANLCGSAVVKSGIWYNSTNPLRVAFAICAPQQTQSDGGATYSTPTNDPVSQPDSQRATTQAQPEQETCRTATAEEAGYNVHMYNAGFGSNATVRVGNAAVTENGVYQNGRPILMCGTLSGGYHLALGER